MGKAVNYDVLDGAFAVLKIATHMVALPAQPADYPTAQATKLADVTMASTDYVNSAGLVNGRRVTVGAKSGVPVLAAGTATHVCLLDPNSTPPRVLYTTTCPAQTLALGGTVSFSPWDVEIGDPT